MKHKTKRKKYLDLVISTTMTLDYLSEITCIETADDEVYIFNYRMAPQLKVLLALMPIALVCLFTPAIVGAFFEEYLLKTFGEYLIGFPFVVLIEFLSVFAILYLMSNREQKFVFNRIHGTITMSAKILNWKNETITFPFNEAKIRFFQVRFNSAMLIKIPGRKFGAIPFVIAGNYYEEEAALSFLVWFMDKNRPLPLLEVFNPYRRKDYLRRKSEGFPPPLYPSLFDTPDADWYIPREDI